MPLRPTAAWPPWQSTPPGKSRQPADQLQPASGSIPAVEVAPAPACLERDQPPLALRWWLPLAAGPGAELLLVTVLLMGGMGNPRCSVSTALAFPDNYVGG